MSKTKSNLYFPCFLQAVWVFISLTLIVINTGCSSSAPAVKDRQLEDLFPVDDVQKARATEKFIIAAGLEAKGDFTSAILEYQEALEIYPSPAVYYALGKNYFYLNKLPPALNHSRKAYSLEPQNIEYAYLLQEIYTSAHLQDSAVLILNRIIALDSTEVQAEFRLAKFYESKRPKQAIEIYKKVLREVPSDWSTLQRIAELYDRLGDLEGCIATIEELRRLYSENFDLDMLLLDYLIRAKKVSQAKDLIDDLSVIYSDNPEVLDKKAQMLMSEGKWQEASKAYQTAIENPSVPLETKIQIGALFFAQMIKDSTLLPAVREIFISIDKDTADWQVKMYLGALYSSERNDSLAELYYQKVIELAPFNPQGWIQLAGLYFDNQKFSEAITIAIKAAEHFPNEFALNFILGIAYAQQSDYALSKKYLKAALELNSQDVNSLAALGYTLYRLNEQEAAIYYLNKALHLEPNSIEVLSTLGLLYDDREDWDMCDTIYQEALAIDPANSILQNNYAYSLSKRGVRLEEALKLVNDALTAEPNSSSFLDTKGWVLHKMGDNAEAKKYVERSIEIGGESAVILDHLGDIEFRLGNKDKATSIWKKAFDLDPTKINIQQKIRQGLD